MNAESILSQMTGGLSICTSSPRLKVSVAETAENWACGSCFPAAWGGKHPLRTRRDKLCPGTGLRQSHRQDTAGGRNTAWVQGSLCSPSGVSTYVGGCRGCPLEWLLNCTEQTAHHRSAGDLAEIQRKLVYLAVLISKYSYSVNFSLIVSRESLKCKLFKYKAYTWTR